MTPILALFVGIGILIMFIGFARNAASTASTASRCTAATSR
jgi:hypothetical protein